MEMIAATAADIPLIRRFESNPENRGKVGAWTEAEHAIVMAEETSRYWLFLTDGRPVGFCILRDLTKPHRNVLLKRIIIDPAGSGHGRPALQALMRWCFRDWDAHRLYLHVFVDNDRARHVYRSLGFREDGLHRETLFMDEAWRSQYLMSILDREYEALQA